MWLPSGDHAGGAKTELFSKSVGTTKGCDSEPSAAITLMPNCQFDCGDTAKAMRFPSGDQTGWMSSLSFSVSLVLSEPSGLAVNIFPV